MLARIAEREIARQVDARRDGDGFILRASDYQGSSGAPLAAPATPAPAQEPAPAQALAEAAPAPEEHTPVEPAVSPAVSNVAPPLVAAAAVMANEAAQQETQAEIPEAEPMADSVAEMPADSIAAKLQRIRAVVSRTDATDVADYSEDQHADAFVSSVAEELTAALEEDDAIEEPGDIAADAELAAAFAAVDAIEAAETEAVTEVAEPTLAEDTVQEDADDAQAETSEPVADAQEEADAELAATLEDLSSELVADGFDDAAPEAEEQEKVEAEEIPVSATALSEQDDTAPAEEASADARETEMASDEIAAEATPYDEDYEDADTADQTDVLSILSAVQSGAPEVASVEAVETEDDDLAKSDDADSDELDLSAFLVGDDTASDEAPQEDEELVDVFEDGDDGEEPRLMRMKKSELEAAIAAGEIEEITEDASEAGDTEDSADAELTPEDEAELMRELAEVEAEHAAEMAPETADSDEELAAAEAEDADADLEVDLEAAPAVEAAEDEILRDDETEVEVSEVEAFEDDASAEFDEPARRLGEEETDEDISRLMAAAEEKLGAPESSANRETYSQLRAAVAVAEAEKSAGGSVDDSEGVDAYREDLASVVRPRRPVVSGASRRPERPESDARPAPLKLVAEQRIDLEDGARSDRGPVRPRRVSAPQGDVAGEAPESGTGGFADFALEMGASELPELLEAAAAYLSFVEGRDQFSRPQLMNKVRQLESHEFNREDGLRSFGQLLREGKIEKTGGGRFTASGGIGYRPDDERAAG